MSTPAQDAIDDVLDLVHDWLMYDGHDFDACRRMSEKEPEKFYCATCDGMSVEPDSDGQLTAARDIMEIAADKLTEFSWRHTQD